MFFFKTLFDLCCNTIVKDIIKGNKVEEYLTVPSTVLARIIERIPLYKTEILNSFYYHTLPNRK